MVSSCPSGDSFNECHLCVVKPAALQTYVICQHLVMHQPHASLVQYVWVFVECFRFRITSNIIDMIYYITHVLKHNTVLSLLLYVHSPATRSFFSFQLIKQANDLSRYPPHVLFCVQFKVKLQFSAARYHWDADDLIEAGLVPRGRCVQC